MLVRRVAVLIAALGVLPRVVWAADSCPDGWFCDDGEAPAEPPPAEPLAPPPKATPLDEAPEPPASVASDGAEDEMHFDVPPEPRSRHRHHRPRREYGFNLHFDGALLGSGAASGAGMAGLGVAFRFRPLPPFAADVGFDFVGGKDYAGNHRSERAFVGNALLFVNPGDPVQVYLLGGVALSQSWVRVHRYGGLAVSAYDASYTHAGVQGGLGVEWRIVRRAAIGADLVALARYRTDSPHGDPEFVDPSTHLATNGSAGGLFRAGATFYF